MHTNFYQLLRSFWDTDIELFDCQIRILSRNAKLMEHDRICWHDNWHNEHDQQQQSLEENSSINTDLAEFQSRLVRLLSSKSLVESGCAWRNYPKSMKRIIKRRYQIRKIMDIVN